MQATVGGELPTAAELMAMRGVVELGEKELDDDAKAMRNSEILKSLNSAASALVEVRQSEGSAIAQVLRAWCEINASIFMTCSLGKILDAVDHELADELRRRQNLPISPIFNAAIYRCGPPVF